MPRCPNCFTPMVRVEEDDIKSLSCPYCFGTWVANIALLSRIRTDAAASTAADTAASPADLAELAEMVTASDSRTPLRCPQCEKPMVKDRYHPLIPVRIDRCKPCGHVWLDTGELSMIRVLYVELTTSVDPEIVRRRDKLAAALSAGDAQRRPVLRPRRIVRPRWRLRSPVLPPPPLGKIKSPQVCSPGFSRAGGFGPGAAAAQVGIVTSSCLSPMLGNVPVGMGYVKKAYAAGGKDVELLAEGSRVKAGVVGLPLWVKSGV